MNLAAASAIPAYKDPRTGTATCGLCDGVTTANYKAKSPNKETAVNRLHYMMSRARTGLLKRIAAARVSLEDEIAWNLYGAQLMKMYFGTSLVAIRNRLNLNLRLLEALASGFGQSNYHTIRNADDYFVASVNLELSAPLQAHEAGSVLVNPAWPFLELCNASEDGLPFSAAGIDYWKPNFDDKEAKPFMESFFYWPEFQKMKYRSWGALLGHELVHCAFGTKDYGEGETPLVAAMAANEFIPGTPRLLEGKSLDELAAAAAQASGSSYVLCRFMPIFRPVCIEYYLDAVYQYQAAKK